MSTIISNSEATRPSPATLTGQVDYLLVYIIQNQKSGCCTRHASSLVLRPFQPDAYWRFEERGARNTQPAQLTAPSHIVPHMTHHDEQRAA